MGVFVVLLEDRHVDPEVTVFRTRDAAIVLADKIALDYPYRELAEWPNRNDGTVMYQSLSGEGDRLLVLGPLSLRS